MPRVDRLRGELVLCNRQRVRDVDVRLLRHITRHVLQDLIRSRPFRLGLHLVTAEEMTRLNEQFLNHRGSTDVLTFDYGDNSLEGPIVKVRRQSGARTTRYSKNEQMVYGEIFISLDDAVGQARRFRTTWQSELVRYIIHGLLHLLGYDDQNSAAHRQMKRAEDRLLRVAAKTCALARLERR